MFVSISLDFDISPQANKLKTGLELDSSATSAYGQVSCDPRGLCCPLLTPRSLSVSE